VLQYVNSITESKSLKLKIKTNNILNNYTIIIVLKYVLGLL